MEEVHHKGGFSGDLVKINAAARAILGRMAKTLVVI
jgi:hypothetical protein